MGISPKIALRYLRAKKICRRENRELMPKDLFTLKGIMVAGTDCGCYKDELEEMWGIRPMELFAGTEPTCIGTETWTKEKGCIFSLMRVFMNLFLRMRCSDAARIRDTSPGHA